MFKDLFAALAAACLLVAVVALFFGSPLGAAGFWLTPLPKVLVWGVLIAALLWSSWPLLRHIGHRVVIVVAGAGLVFAMSACSTLGGLPTGGAAGSDQLLQVMTAVNTAVSQNCSGAFNVTWAPPLPPSGSASLNCQVKPPVVVPLAAITPATAAALTTPPAK